MPTVLVFLGSLALWPTLSDRTTGLTWLDGVAALVMLTAVIIEGTADLQMRRFRRKPESAGEGGSPGVWCGWRPPHQILGGVFLWGEYRAGALWTPNLSRGILWPCALFV